MVPSMGCAKSSAAIMKSLLTADHDSMQRRLGVLDVSLATRALARPPCRVRGLGNPTLSERRLRHHRTLPKARVAVRRKVGGRAKVESTLMSARYYVA